MTDLIQQKKTTKSHVHSLECSSPRWFKIRKHLNLVSWPIIFWCRVLVRTTRTLNIWTLLFFLPTAFPANSTSDFRYTYVVEIYHSAPGNFFAQSSLICSWMSWGSSQIYIVQFRHTKLFKRPIFSSLQRRVHRQLWNTIENVKRWLKMM